GLYDLIVFKRPGGEFGVRVFSATAGLIHRLNAHQPALVLGGEGIQESGPFLTRDFFDRHGRALRAGRPGQWRFRLLVTSPNGSPEAGQSWRMFSGSIRLMSLISPALIFSLSSWKTDTAAYRGSISRLPRRLSRILSRNC